MRKLLSLLLAFVVFFYCSGPVFAAEADSNAAIDILHGLGARQMKMVRENAQGDNLIENPVSRINFNHTSYALLDESGDIIRINRLDEIDALYNGNTRNASEFSSKDELIDYIKTRIIGTNYELTQENNFDESTISLKFDKLLSNGAHDNYDSYSVFIDSKYIELVALYKRTSEFVEKKETPIITASKAIEVASAVMDTTSIISTELKTVKTNHFYNKDFAVGEIKLAYIIKNQSMLTYIDAYTGMIIGGDIFKSVRGGVIGAPDISTAYSSIDLAKTAFENMGYASTTKVYSSKFGTEVPSLLHYAFYSCSHGNSSVISSKKDITDPDRVFYAKNVPSDGVYRLVFLDACETASSTWTNAFGINNSSSYKAFFGWSQTVGAQSAYEFCQIFWNGVSKNKPIRQVAIDASMAQGDSLPISFTGDRDFNGYY